MNNRLALFATFTLAALVSAAARADVIADWNRTAADYLNQHASSHYARGLTMVHVAQFDAVNAVVGGYTSYALDVAAPGASPEAAAAQAAYTVLTNLSRGSVSTLNSALARSLTAVPDGPAKEAGLALGRLAATRIFQLRAADNPDLPITPTQSTAPGKWRITPPNSPPAYGANRRYQQPWTMRSPAQFRPGPPPALASAQYAADVEEVRLLGGRVSTNRTPDIAQAADFHYAGIGTFLAAVRERSALPLIESARQFAMAHMLMMDADIAFLEAQYAYSFWRPYSAIRLAETDGNDATAADPTWNPMFDTPNHPEYPSGTCTLTSAILHFLIEVHGDDFGFTVQSELTPTAGLRTFPRLSAMIDDAVVARIAAGAHYRNSCVVGVDLGRNIARHAVANFLRPLPRLAGGTPPAAGGFQLQVTSGPPFSYVVETSGDLAQWTPWLTNLHGAVLLTDPGAPADRRFYRAVLPEP